MKITLTLVVLILSTSAFAFPNLVRKGYTSCNVCHFNPQGGGSLNSYGKYVAADSLGTFNDYDSAQGFLTPPKSEEDESANEYVVAFLGRGARVKAETHVGEFKKDIAMQADIEAAFKHDNWIGLLTFGQRLDSRNEALGESSDDIFIRRYYIGRQTEDYTFRLGKFFTDFGINHANHNLRTRDGLYFGPNQETMTAQASYTTNKFKASVSAIQGNENTKLQDHVGYSTDFNLREGSNLLGLSMIDMMNDANGTSDNSINLYGMSGYLGKGYTLAEFVERKKITGTGTINSKRIGYIETGWEVYKGFTPFLNYQYEEDYQRDSYFKDTGFGFQFTPYTHFEFNFQYFSNEFPGGAARTTYGTINIYY